ncbi:DNA-binding transcriptional MerR regulator [Humibacillus xanthopallidus]|uniref:DNA-binding transcriptional MerR regulator n=1 Tax=Humibacillus xanthopallidus TaxID=412689 RepID=A0A543PVD4_9MICO|nr:MerR family transcriptional regulator [Humibacillus xanthopallidus]TQN48039.1 DNA-binding transcriptional MerR regulator [Humibacillus xanthopallidus]
MQAPSRPDPDRLLTIGELARRSGLSASALRFYDREGVLVPADVDALTGYRRYAAAQVRAARLLASLRRVGMPLAEAALVLDEDARGASGAAADVVTAHEQRLVDGLADARREIVRTLALLAERGAVAGGLPRVTVRAGDLAAALASVRFAVAPGEPVAGAPDGPDLRVLTGILLEVSASEVRCVATDRYRLAVGWAPAVSSVDSLAGDSSLGGSAALGAPADRVAVVVPVDWADRVAAACREAEAPNRVEVDVQVDVQGEGVGVRIGGDLIATAAVPGSFPDYRAILAPEPRGETVDAGGLSGRLQVERETVGLVVRDGSVLVAVRDDAGADGVADVYVDPEFLHEALAVAGSRPTLVLDGPHRPLAIRGDSAGFSVLMPVAPSGSR